MLEIIGGALLLLFPAIVVVLGFPWLAEENVLFTTVQEGTVKAIMRGDSFERFIMSFEDYHLNDPLKPWYKGDRPSWDVIYHGKNNKDGFADEEMDDEHYDDRSWLLKSLGLYWVGWPWANSVYVYQFEWNETYTDKESGKEKVLPRAEATDFIYVSDFTYAIVTDAAETKDRLPTDEQTLTTVAIRNPYRALFSGEDWMRRITAAINRHVRVFVGNKEYQQLIELDLTAGMTEFSAPIIELNDKLPDDKEAPFGLRGRYGVEIRTADLQTVELTGGGKEQYQAAATKAYVAEQNAKAIRTEGQANADVIQMTGSREAEALEARLTVISKHGDDGRLLAQLDAMRESSKGAGNTIIWANNPFVPLAASLSKPEAKGDQKS